jgi:hypothetical protein
LAATACVRGGPQPPAELHGIRPGISQDDVRFLQGKADSAYADSSVWIYRLPGEWLFVGFQLDTVRWILSYEATEPGVVFPYELQPRVAGTTFGDRAIDTVLGPPTDIERSADGTMRYYFYSQRAAVFGLRHNSVFMVGLFDPRAPRPSFGRSR